MEPYSSHSLPLLLQMQPLLVHYGPRYGRLGNFRAEGRSDGDGAEALAAAADHPDAEAQPRQGEPAALPSRREKEGPRARRRLGGLGGRYVVSCEELPQADGALRTAASMP